MPWTITNPGCGLAKEYFLATSINIWYTTHWPSQSLTDLCGYCWWWRSTWGDLGLCPSYPNSSHKERLEMGQTKPWLHTCSRALLPYHCSSSQGLTLNHCSHQSFCPVTHLALPYSHLFMLHKKPLSKLVTPHITLRSCVMAFVISLVK